MLNLVVKRLNGFSAVDGEYGRGSSGKDPDDTTHQLDSYPSVRADLASEGTTGTKRWEATVGLGGRWQLALLVVALHFQGAQSQFSYGGLIVGQVIDAGTGRPMAGVLVMLIGSPAGTGQLRPPVLTGTDGRFLFRDMARGNYNITAVKPGYVDGAYGRTRPGGPSSSLALNDAERRDDIAVRMWRHAALSGTVTDESGERQVGVLVRAYRRTVAGGRRRFASAGSASTDDRGMYRIGTLTPGDYIVGTAPRHLSVPLSLVRDGTTEGQQMTAELTGRGGALVVRDAGYVLGRGSSTPPPPVAGRLAVYPAIYHPSAPAGDAASIIPLQPGQDYDGADIQLAPVASVSMSGFIIGPDGPVTSTPIRLVPAATLEVTADGDGLATMTDRQGGFVFPAVPSGHYALKLNRGQSAGFPGRGGIEPAVIWVDLPVTVGSEDIESLGVTANAGLRINGRFEFDGDPSRPRGSLQTVQIVIEPADNAAGNLARAVVARANASGEFTSPPLPGGRYYVRIADSPSGWMFKGATVEGRDVTDTPLTVTSDTSNVTVQFTDRWSGLGGRVQADRGPAGDVAVIVFPTDIEAWGSSGQSPRRLRLSRVKAGTGDYSFTLPAGDYYVIAIPDERAADWQDANFLEDASRDAIRVRIADGERKVQDVRVRVTR